MSRKINKQDIENIYALSPLQEGILYTCLSAGRRRSGLYFEQLTIGVRGTISNDIFIRSWNTVIASNPVLRTVFRWEGLAQPVQIVLKSHQLIFNYFKPETGSELLLIKENDLNSGFDLESVPFRINLCKIDEEKYEIIISFHHIILDGWSTGIILSEFDEIYTTLINGKDISSQNYIKTPFSEYISHIRNLDRSKILEFWKDELKHAESTKFSLARPVLDNMGETRYYISRSYTCESSEELNALALELNVTKAAVLYSVWAILISVYNNTGNVVFGTAVSGRNVGLEGLDRTAGLFINTIPLNCKIEPEKRISELIVRVNRSLIDRSGYEVIPLPEILSAIRKRDLFDSLVVIENYPLKSRNFGKENKFEIEHICMREEVDYPLMLEIELTEKIGFKISFDGNVFEPAIVSDLCSNMNRILETVLCNSEKRIRDIDIISAEEKDRILNVFNKAYLPDQPDMKSLSDIFRELTACSPDRVALVYHDRFFTYSELCKRSLAVSEKLDREMCPYTEPVGIFLDRSPELIISILGVINSGRIYLAIDTSYPAERIKFITEDAGVKTIITSRGSQYPNEKHALIIIDEIIDNCSASAPEQYVPRKKSDTNKIYVIYTSGSTGLPKGVIGNGRGLLNRLSWGWSAYPFEKDDRCCIKTSVGFVDHVAEIFSPLLKGVTSIIFDNSDIEDVIIFTHLISKYGITRITLVPSLLKAMIESGEVSELEIIKYVFCSGEILPGGLIAAFKNNLLSSSLINIYGSSEVSADVTWHDVVIGRSNTSMKYFYPDLRLNSIMDNINEKRDNKFTAADVDFNTLVEKMNNTEVPVFPESTDDYYKKLINDVIPYSVDTNSPYFVGHMTSKLPFYVHELSHFISVLNQNMVKLETSKSLTLIEKQTLGMLHRKIYKKSEDFYKSAFVDPNSNFGVITSCGSIANLTSLLVARNKKIFDSKENSGSVFRELCSKGYKDAVVIGSSLMHYSFNKTASVLGFGKNNIIHVDNELTGSIDLLKLEQAILRCIDEKIFIIAVVGIAGATETGQIDPLRQIGEIASKYKIHYHVDAAWGGPILFSDKYSYLLSGIENADSVTMCGHKQFYLPQGISFCVFKDTASLSHIQVNARYQAIADSFDTGKISIEGSRPATALLLHSVLHIFGKNGLEYLINTGIEKAMLFSRYLGCHPAFELISIPSMNIVNYRYIPKKYREKLVSSIVTEDENIDINRINEEIQEIQFQSGRTFVSKTVLFSTKHNFKKGITVFRMVISNPLTTPDHLLANIHDQLMIAKQICSDNDDIDLFSWEDSKNMMLQCDEANNRSSIIGRSIPNTQLYIVNRYFKLLPVSLPGELLIAGYNLSDGYLNRPDLTSEKFIWWDPETGTVYPDHSKPESAVRVYRTGDLCRFLPDGNVEFLGRIDHQVKIRGFRIELGEIENRLLGVEGIKESVVLARDDSSGGKYLAAYLVSEKEYESGELRKELSRSLPEYMIPSYFVFLEKIPLTSNGKVDRRSLPEPEIVVKEYVAPKNDTEAKLVEIWSEVLGIDKDKISTDSNFFELGGHSLKATGLMSKIHKVFGVKLKLDELFRSPVINDIAIIIELAVGLNREICADDKTKKRLKI